MRKWISLLAAIALILTVCPVATAESAFPTWTNGLSAQQPYEGVPPVDLTTKLGYMVFSPLNGAQVATGLCTLSIYLPRTDVVPGAGSLNVYAAGAKQPYETVAFSDAARVTVQPIDEADKQWLYWESGVCFTVRLARALPVDGNYYVTLDADCIQAPDYAISNHAMTDKDHWTFGTAADYGVVSAEWPADVTVGGAATVEVKLGGAAASATIVGYVDVEVSCAPESIEQSGEIAVNFPGEGLAEWGVTFMDAQGNPLATYQYSTTVNPAPAQP